MYAVINLKGHQYIVNEGMKIDIDNLDVKDGESYLCEQVLATFDEEGKDVRIGEPFLETAKVEFNVVKTYKGDKINVLKFKRKTRYKREIGFRPLKTLLEVKKIIQ